MPTMHLRSLTSIVLLTLLAPPASCQDSSTAQSNPFSRTVQPLLAKHCSPCHSKQLDKPKGNFRIDLLTADFSAESVRERWEKVRERVVAGEMPPESRPRLPERDLNAIVDWITQQLDRYNPESRTESGIRFRRLNRVEYENTIRDLLDVRVDLKEMLPPDTSADGFDNVADALHVSPFLMESYLEAADKALSLAIANHPQPQSQTKRYLLGDERHVKVTTERVFRPVADSLVMFSSSSWQAITLGQFYPPERGTYRFRISAHGFQSDGQPVTFRVDAGPMLMGTKNHLVGYFDVPPNEPTIIEFTDHFEARSTIRILPFGLATAQAVHQIGADEYTGAGLAVDWVEVEGPIHDVWPPPSHRSIFGEIAQAAAPINGERNRVEVTSQDPIDDAQRILRGFAGRAFRRTATDDDVRRLMPLVQANLDAGCSFEQAVRVGLKAILLAPDFLFRAEGPGQLDQFALASRLSYFLWSTMPDESLLTLAEQQQLGQAEVLREQVERLLHSPKSVAFTENFVGQWLGLRDIDFTEPDRRLYPEFDDLLKASMITETEMFFSELLNNDLSVANFVASDFAILNERLAKHYGIEGVTGHAFRKIQLPPGSHRGGVMTMASVLKVTANGSTTSPVTRGAWVLDRILGTPPKPPPPGVPAIEPDIRGATTIREQLAKHRQIESCATCHIQIDPPGFALENFDVIGGWREYYRSVGNGKPVTIDGRRMPYAQGPAVDPSDRMPDGRSFRDIDELKQMILADKEQVARALTSKILTYATGRSPRPADSAAIDRIVRGASEHDYGFRTLIHELVQSDLFRN